MGIASSRPEEWNLWALLVCTFSEKVELVEEKVASVEVESD